MGKGAKIAIGCFVVALVGAVAVSALLFGGLWWAKGKAEKFVGDQKKIEDLQKSAAAAAPFTAPADGVIQEDRLVKFLEIRRRVYGIYELHKTEFEAMGNKKEKDLGDVTKAFGFINEIRTAQAQAQADVGMGNDEYRYLVGAIYKTLWASEIAKNNGGKSVSEGVADTYDKAAAEMEKSARELPPGSASSDQQKMVDDALRRMREQSQTVRDGAKALDVPRANIDLFRKHEDEIKKYAMNGLEMIGL